MSTRNQQTSTPILTRESVVGFPAPGEQSLQDASSFLAQSAQSLLSSKQRTRRFFAYSGSLTEPPCSENVNWILLDERIKIDGQRLAQLRKLSGVRGFARPNTRLLQFQYQRSILASFDLSQPRIDDDNGTKKTDLQVPELASKDAEISPLAEEQPTDAPEETPEVEIAVNPDKEEQNSSQESKPLASDGEDDSESKLADNAKSNAEPSNNLNVIKKQTNTKQKLIKPKPGPSADAEADDLQKASVSESYFNIEERAEQMLRPLNDHFEQYLARRPLLATLPLAMNSQFAHQKALVRVPIQRAPFAHSLPQSQLQLQAYQNRRPNYNNPSSLAYSNYRQAAYNY